MAIGVLIVDDHPIVREGLRRALERDPAIHVMGEAETGTEVITEAQRLRPDVILMDLSLPVLDGWQATREIKAAADTKHIPVIALTANAMAGDREKALAAGCDDYDTKPVELPRLLGKIKQLVERAGS